MGKVLLVLAVFAACVVESVEALTIVLAVGITRGWRATLRGVAAGLVVLALVVAVLGPALTVIPIEALRLVVGGPAADLRPGLAAQGHPARVRVQGLARRGRDLQPTTRGSRAGPRHRPGPARRPVCVHVGVQGGPAGRVGSGVHRADVRG